MALDTETLICHGAIALRRVAARQARIAIEEYNRANPEKPMTYGLGGIGFAAPEDAAVLNTFVIAGLQQLENDLTVQLTDLGYRTSGETVQ